MPESKPGVDTARTVLKIYDGMKKMSDIFEGADENGMLLAESCQFKPGAGMICEGGVMDLLTNSGIGDTRRLAQEMEDTFVTYDAGGLPVSPTHRWLQGQNCDDFEEAPCEGSCSGCSSKTKKAKCNARKLRCKGKNTEGLSFPFMNDPASVLGLLTGNDIQILEFNPPPLTFAFSYQFATVLYTPPFVNLIIDFGVSVTVEYSIVLDSRGIREAVKESNPAKALESFALRDTFDGVDKPLIIFEAEVGASVEVSAVFLTIGVRGGITIRVEIDVSFL